ncbi:hypothetical protein EHW65_15935 [Erwinia psidii]|uniref:DotU family type IV/VI secretion system protein n=1 Tax=Erwinia psidii TaxID=69224 RepID=UPI00226B92FF|nr:DotU family type IV/VI secretion system protein [Erwinia psidii]MCX8958682.1 hypothetical protein [Erwinia psidii]
MVKSEIYFNRIIFIDTLLSFNGIILSLTEFQLKLINLIEQFSKELISEGQSEELSDELCHIICSYFDEHITLRLNANNISWKRNLLAHHFYGYNADVASLGDRLEILLERSEGKIFDYTCRLIPFILRSLGANEKITLLLSYYKQETAINKGPETEEKNQKKALLSFLRRKKATGMTPLSGRPDWHFLCL